ncbi:MAG: alpha/beta hydrolase [Gemmatimonadaceae bacterium]
MIPALALLAALAAGRATYPRLLERRQRARRRLGSDGVIEGAAEITRLRENATGVLLLHGGGDTPQVVSELAEYLYEHGFSVRAPLLEGHGRDLRALERVTASRWHAQVHRELEELRRTHPRIAVIGLSMGGALAVQAAADYPDLMALVLLAPYIAMPEMVRRLAETSTWWGWAVPYFSSFGSRSIRDAAAAERALGHGILTPAMLRALRDVVDDAWNVLPRVKAPTLVIQSREDNRIAAESAELGFTRLGAAEKKFVWTNDAGHVITVDFGFQRVYELTRAWVEAHRKDVRRPSVRARPDSR